MFASALELCFRALAEGIRPDPALTITSWAEERRYVPGETSSRPGKWKNRVAPHLEEIMEMLSPVSPVNRITFVKSAQIGGSELIMNALGFIVDVAPGPAMVVHPTLTAGNAWSKEKLDPNIEGNPSLRDKVRDTRTGRETAGFKKFPGGFLVITGANSTADLRQKSIKYLFKDDWDDWPHDLGEQGDPDKMANARQISYHATANYKCLEVSTPTLVSTSRSWNAYQNESDMRVREICCPGCGHWQELRFFPLDKDKRGGGLVFETDGEPNAYYVCEKGCIIEEHQKDAILDGARWRVTNPGKGKHPGYKINALYSKTTTWNKMVEVFLEAKDKVNELKAFWNLWMGEPWAERGDAPDWKRLLTLRQGYQIGTIPVGGLIVTLGADVQKDGIFFDVEAWGAGMTRWSIDFGFIQGDTSRDEVWLEFAKVLKRRYRNAWGKEYPIDYGAIDANFNKHKVHAFVRRTPKMLAIRGVPGASAPILGTPSKEDLRMDGKRKTRSFQVWPVGTWSAKMEFYANLRLEGIREGKDEDPLGSVFFSTAHDENYLKQVTAESLVTRTKHGKTKTEWETSGPNHFLDCKVYSRAAAEHLALSRLTLDEWEKLAKIRNIADDNAQGDLLSLSTELSAAQPASRSSSGKTGEGSNPSAGQAARPPAQAPADVPPATPPAEPKPSNGMAKMKKPRRRFGY